MSSSAGYGIITPEAVVLELAPAGLATRAFAKLIDLLCMALLLLVLVLIIGLAGQFAPSISAVILYTSILVVMFVLPIVVEAIWNGKSPGKAVVGLRVVTVDGGPIQFRHAAVRGLLQPIDIYAGIGALPALFRDVPNASATCWPARSCCPIGWRRCGRRPSCSFRRPVVSPSSPGWMSGDCPTVSTRRSAGTCCAPTSSRRMPAARSLCGWRRRSDSSPARAHRRG